MEFFLLVYRAPVHDARSGAFQLHPISYSPVELFIGTDVQNSQIFTTTTAFIAQNMNTKKIVIITSCCGRWHWVTTDNTISPSSPSFHSHSSHIHQHLDISEYLEEIPFEMFSNVSPFTSQLLLTYSSVTVRGQF